MRTALTDCTALVLSQRFIYTIAVVMHDCPLLCTVYHGCLSQSYPTQKVKSQGSQDDSDRKGEGGLTHMYNWLCLHSSRSLHWELCTDKYVNRLLHMVCSNGSGRTNYFTLGVLCCVLRNILLYIASLIVGGKKCEVICFIMTFVFSPDDSFSEIPNVCYYIIWSSCNTCWMGLVSFEVSHTFSCN